MRVSRETLRVMSIAPVTPRKEMDPSFREKMERYVDLLDRWRHVTNLISASAFEQIWTRHILDCAQILPYAPNARKWIDMGSGAGLPGIVIAAQLFNTPEAMVHCVESDQRKCAYLREVVRTLNLPATIHAERIEQMDASHIGPVDAITARALASLPKLLGYAKPFFAPDTVALFPRGQSDDGQLDPSDAKAYRVERFPSATDSRACILRIRRNL